MLPVRPALAAAAAAAAASEPRLLLPPARDIPLPSATSARDVRCSRSPAPSAPAAKKKATADTSTGRPTPSAILLPPPPKAEVTQRLSIAKEAATRSATVQSHEDLARKLKRRPKKMLASKQA